VIESLENARVKEAVKLRDRRARTKAGRFLVEGRRELTHALEAGWIPDHVFVEETGAGVAGRALVETASGCGARVLSVSPAVYAKLAVRDRADGIVAVVPVPDVSPDRLRLAADALVLAAVGIEKPGNVGALLRSADAFGADAFVVEGGTDLWNPNVVRASLGCLFTVPLAVVPAGGMAAWLRSGIRRVIAAVPDGSSLPAATDLTGPVALLVGSEEHGLPPDLVAGADARVRIPMRGRADSLNVSVSAGILLYEADRQRQGRR
jgi:TrmH family RNA methyltransferase